MSVSGLQQLPAIWEAYVRGWQGCVACMPPPPMPRASVLATWPTLPVVRAQAPRQLPPRQPLTGRPMLPPTSQQPMPARSAGVTKTRPKVQPTERHPLQGHRCSFRGQEEVDGALAKFRQSKRQTMRQQIQESQGTTSQQFRLVKHGETLDSPAVIATTGPPAPDTQKTPPRDEEQPMETEEQSTTGDKLEEELKPSSYRNRNRPFLLQKGNPLPEIKTLSRSPSICYLIV